MKKREKENSFLSLTPIFIIPLAVILWMYFFFIKENKFVRETLLSGWIGIIVLLVFEYISVHLLG